MTDLIESFYNEIGVVLIILLSSFTGLICAKISQTALRWFCTISIPIPLAYFLYWILVWFVTGRTDSSEYSSWVGVIVIPWYVIGVFTSIILMKIVLKRKFKNVLKKDT